MDESQVMQLKRTIDQADTILWLADNAGETVFDRLLIEHLSGKRLIEAGLEPFVELIDNGTNAPGTALSLCSPTFREVFDQADIVIAKGQANFETLNEVDRDVYFLTQIKCAVIVRHYGYGVGDWIVTTPLVLAQRLDTFKGGLR